MRRFASTALLAALAVCLLGRGTPSVAAEMTPAQEMRVGEREHPQVVRRFGGEYGDVAIRQYVADIGARLVRTLSDPMFDFTFTVLDAPDPFAFAMPGGYVYISRQMLALANSEAEVAAVLAHEIAHIVLRHANQRAQLQDRMEADTPVQNAEAMHAFTREQELEADAVSVRTLAQARYDPMAQARFLATIGEQSDLALRAGAPRPRDPATHPSVQERIRRASYAARQVEQREQEELDARNPMLIAGYMPIPQRERPKWIVERDAFLNIIDGMVYGPRPSEGMVVGSKYIDTYNRYTFTLPPGFHFTRTSTTIIAAGPEGSSMKFDILPQRAPQTEGMIAYLARMVAPGISLEQMEEQTIGNAPAAFGRATMLGGNGYKALVLIAVIRVTQTTYFRFQFYLPEPLSRDMADRAWEAPLSFKRLTDADIQAIQPMRIRVLTAEPDTQIEALAAQMRMIDHPMEWLSMLNHLAPGADPAGGSRIKMVVQP